MKHISTLYLLLFFLMTNLTGCALRKAAVHPDPSGFIIRRDDDDPGIVSTRMPFMYYWQDPNYGSSERGKKFRNKKHYILYVKPVGTNYLALENKRKDFAKAVNRVADYLSKRIITEIKQYKEGSYQVLVEKDRDEADFALEIELTEVGFGTPVFYVAAWAIPLPGVATIFDANFTGCLAFEARIIDLSSDNIDVEFYDRKIPKIRLFDINKAISQSGPLRDISNDWAKEIAQAVSARIDRDEVKKRKGFTLVPW